jgi:hypothetical protein
MNVVLWEHFQSPTELAREHWVAKADKPYTTDSGLEVTFSEVTIRERKERKFGRFVYKRWARKETIWQAKSDSPGMAVT